MRKTQVFGLKDEALEFLKENVERKPDVVCPKCGEIITHIENMRIYENARSAGMQCDGPKLHEYILKDGRTIREVINRYRPWSKQYDALCLFLDLVDIDGNVLYEWKKGNIDGII